MLLTLLYLTSLLHASPCEIQTFDAVYVQILEKEECRRIRKANSDPRVRLIDRQVYTFIIPGEQSIGSQGIADAIGERAKSFVLYDSWMNGYIIDKLCDLNDTVSSFILPDLGDLDSLQSVRWNHKKAFYQQNKIRVTAQRIVLPNTPMNRFYVSSFQKIDMAADSLIIFIATQIVTTGQ